MAYFTFKFAGLWILVVSHVLVNHFDVEELLVATLDDRRLFMNFQVMNPKINDVHLLLLTFKAI